MKRFSALIAALTIMLSAAASMPQVIAHRGYWKTEGSAQNSIRSLVKADSIGCYGSEFDVWLTADDVLVVNHNRDINGKVIETGNSAELLQERLSNGEYMPSLSQYLDAAKALKVELILEVKPHSDSAREDVAVPKIIEMVAEKGLTDRTTYITFSRHALDLLVEQSGRPVYYLTGVNPDVLKESGATGADFHISHFRKNPDWLLGCRDYDMPINIWTIANLSDLQYCIDHEADFVTTDIPEDAINYIKEQDKPLDLKVMTYNLHAGSDAFIGQIADEIKAADVDFVALQELDAYTSRANARHQNGRNMVVELAAATGMFPLYARTLNFAGGYYGIGMLSKHPCVESQALELPNMMKKEPRALLKGTFEVDGKRRVVFASTHLCVEDSATRVQQAQYIVRNLSDERYPVILGGDFNSLPDSEPIAIIEQVLTNLSGTEPTFPSSVPADKLDYIFGSPGLKVTSVTIPSSGNSDHRPVIVSVTDR